MKREISIATDYAADVGNPEPYLQRISEAGFAVIHWCHHWNTDFAYGESELVWIAKWLKEYGLRLNDLHASVGPEKNWGSPREHERLAGVELVKNRIDMAARLGGGAIVMHLAESAGGGDGLDLVRASLDAIEPYAKSRGVRIALENGDFDRIGKLLAEYDPGYLGLCYDSGHGNMAAGSGARLDALKGRLVAMHLHDNDGLSDQHKIPFMGTVDWRELARLAAGSSYGGPVTLEVSMRNCGIAREDEFLLKALEAGRSFAGMLAEASASGL